MNNGERDALVMRHLERAYRASYGNDTKIKIRGGNEGEMSVEDAIIAAIAILHRRITSRTS